MKAKTIKGISHEEIKKALTLSIADGFKPILALVFLSITQDRNAVCEILNTQEIAIFGATTNGEFINDEIRKNSTAIILFDIKPDYFTIIFEEFQHRNFSDASERIAKKALEKFQKPAFLILGSDFKTDAEEIILGFENVCGKDVNIFGGMAGDDYAFKDQFVFTNSKSSDHGLIALVFDENKILIRGKATHGWKAVGTPKTVTKSEGNHVFTVDGVSVLELTKKYGGLDELTEANNQEQLALIATNFPLQLQREKGDPVMRPGLVIDWQDGSFYCGGKVPQGSKVRFSLPPDFDVIDKVVNGLKDLKKAEMPEADAVIVFSCAGRIVSLGPLMDKEIEGIYKIWNAPMAGFFSNGEIARATAGNNDLHNLTACCVVLKEK